MRLDYNLRPKHRLSGVYNWQVVERDPDQLNGGDVRFPGAPNYSHYLSYRPLASGSLRSTLTSNLVNELRGGISGAPRTSASRDTDGPQTFEDIDGLALDLVASNANAIGSNLTNWHRRTRRAARSAWSLEHRQHGELAEGDSTASSFGAALFLGTVWKTAQQIVPGITFGVEQRRSGVRAVHDGEFPGRVDRAAHRRARALRDARRAA